MADQEGLEDFIRQLTLAQPRLAAYLRAATGNSDDAAEIHQRTNLALWKNAESFKPGSPFMPWAVTLAKYELLSFYRDRSRDRHLFTEDVALLMLESAASLSDDWDLRRDALRECVGELADRSRSLVRMRYEDGEPIAAIAKRTQKSANAVKLSLLRIRRALQACILRKLSHSSSSPAR